MKIEYLKLKKWLLVSLGGLLGINMVACGGEEYGCPEGTYHVRGTVTNEEGDPIEGIGVGKRYLEEWPEFEYYDTTDSDGRYDVRILCDPGEPSQIEIVDIDAEQHGHYRDTVVTVVAGGNAFHGGDGNWYAGTANIEKDITLQRFDK
jgi:putative lipoprotein (rSAM/lipoprotein system)